MTSDAPYFWFDDAIAPAALTVLSVAGDAGPLHAVRHSGTGPPVLLLPGLMDPWHSFAPALPELAAFCVPVMLDWRGHGASAPAADAAYTVLDYARDAASVLRSLDAPAFVAGNSLGALVALRLAVAAPDRVRGVLLEDGPFFFTEAPGWDSHWLQAARFRPLLGLLQHRDAASLDAAAFARLHAELPFPLDPELSGHKRDAWLARLASRLQPVVSAMPIDQRDRWLRRGPPTACPRWADLLPPPIHDRIAAQDFRTATGAVATACTNRFSAGFDHAASLAALARPMRALVADPDVSRTVPAWVGQRIAGLGRGPVETVPGAGHTIHRDRPDRFAAALRGLIEEAA